MKDNEMRSLIRVYDDVLPLEFCRQTIEHFDNAARLQMRNGAGVREGLEQSGWTELNVTRHAEPTYLKYVQDIILRRFEQYNDEIGLSLRISPVHRLADLMLKCYRVDQGDGFQLHFDSIRAHANRYLVFLWYLNDVREGGETWFPDLDVKIAPKAGRMLIFPPYWMYQHVAVTPRSNDKYIVSTYALY